MRRPLVESILTHTRSLFTVEELQDIELQEPFPFTKGCRTMKIASPGSPHGHIQDLSETLLFDLDRDYQEEHKVDDTDVESKRVCIERDDLICRVPSWAYRLVDGR